MSQRRRSLAVCGRSSEAERQLIGGLVVACRSAGLAIQQPVIAKTHVNHGLAQAAILLTLAIAFGLLALRAAIFGGPGSGAHEITLSLVGSSGNMTSVTTRGQVRGQGMQLFLSVLNCNLCSGEKQHMLYSR